MKLVKCDFENLNNWLERGTLLSKRKEVLWDLEEHSFGKHLVLQKYINAWFPILSKFNGRLLFIDGFAGPCGPGTGPLCGQFDHFSMSAFV